MGYAKRMSAAIIGRGLVLAVIGTVSVAALAGPVDYPRPTAYPKEDRGEVARHLSLARAAAGDEWRGAMEWRCLISPLDRPRVAGVQHDGLIEPTRLFDNLFSIGQNAVSAYALDTREGIILIDALNSPEEARDILVPNMKAMGLDPARIRYVVVTHGHGDHYGGAAYLQATYGAKVIASVQDWPLIETPQTSGPFAGLVPPVKDRAVNEGDTLSLGEATMKFHVTPGHTKGTLSLLFEVTEAGRRHVAGLMGGTGGGATAPALREQLQSLARWRAIAKKGGADVLITNHPAHNSSVEREVLLRYRLPGETNPFVIGRKSYSRFMEVMSECTHVQLARLGERP